MWLNKYELVIFLIPLAAEAAYTCLRHFIFRQDQHGDYKELCLFPCFRLALHFCYRILACDLFFNYTFLICKSEYTCTCSFLLLFYSAERLVFVVCALWFLQECTNSVFQQVTSSRIIFQKQIFTFFHVFFMTGLMKRYMCY